MASSPVSSPIEAEVGRIRELSKAGRHTEALSAAEALAEHSLGNRDLLYLIAANQRCLNRITDALATLERLEQNYPRFSLLYQERGHCYVTLRNALPAIEAFNLALEINPALPASWSMLERLYRLTGQMDNAALAAEQLSALSQIPSEIVQAGSLFSDGSLSAAENILRSFLRTFGNHAEALRLLARIEHQRDVLDEAEALLETALKLAPSYRAARFDYVHVLLDRQKYLEARETLESLLAPERHAVDHSPSADNNFALSVYAAACAGLGEQERAIALYRDLLFRSPDSSNLYVSLGNSLKTIGRLEEAQEAFQAAAEARPGFGDAWWSLANLKIYRFTARQIARMLAEEASPSAQTVDRYHLCFALGKALEDQAEYAESWKFYEKGNTLKRAESCYRPEITETDALKQREVCTAPFFAARKGVGLPARDPIFIVGLPRSGSTLIEQILASHSQVEGTQELPDIQRIVLQLSGRRSDLQYPRYPRMLAELTCEEFCRLGEQYLAGTRVYRKERPHFVDKMPNNFRHIGLIHLMLPNARIIDVRREPIACCFSNLKQLFARGQDFTYSMEDIARYYRSYLDLMQHWDAVLPGRVFRVCYENLVEDLEGKVRRMLDYCGLEFEPACLEFYRTERSVSTASSEQVRRPIFRSGLNQWRNYEPWLDPLKSFLGDALVRYRE